MTKEADFNYKRNGINTLRLFAAIQVMWGHFVLHLETTFPMIGGILVDEIISWVLYFFLGVPLFFFLSGFLIWVSIDKYRSCKSYYINRVLRIYPELWVGVAMECVCLIVMLSSIDWKDLFLFAGTQATVLQFWTPDSLRSFGCGTPNGSLWTICVMVQFYIIVWPLKKLCRGKKISFWLVMEFILMFVGAMTKYIGAFVPEVVYKLYCQTVIQYMWIFWLGMMVAEFKEIIIPKLMNYWYVPAVGALVMRFSPFDIWSRSYPIVLCVFSLMALLGLSYRLPKINLKTDISYALFIYHMIVANIFIQMGYKSIVSFIVCSVVSFVIAYLSTIFVGKNVLKHKLSQ